jgi:phosphate starvation-inducible protein PhoH and related proteins
MRIGLISIMIHCFLVKSSFSYSRSSMLQGRMRRLTPMSAARGGGGGGGSVGRGIAPLYKPRNLKQGHYVDALEDKNIQICLGVGPAGTGKTLFACHSAIQGYEKGLYTKIILTRPVVPVEEEELGFLPGSVNKKMDPWVRPIMDIFLEYYDQRTVDAMIQRGAIEIAPLGFMRGRTFKHTFILADEIQNARQSQVLMLATRIGHESKLVITGDLKQSDICGENGLEDFIRRIESCGGVEGISIVEFAKDDVERSPIVQRVLDLY